jgi:hypothetical protein
LSVKLIENSGISNLGIEELFNEIERLGECEIEELRN